MPSDERTRTEGRSVVQSPRDDGFQEKPSIACSRPLGSDEPSRKARRKTIAPSELAERRFESAVARLGDR